MLKNKKKIKSPKTKRRVRKKIDYKNSKIKTPKRSYHKSLNFFSVNASLQLFENFPFFIFYGKKIIRYVYILKLN